MIEAFLIGEGYTVHYHSPGGNYRDHLSVERSLNSPIIIFNVGMGPTTVMAYEQARWVELGTAIDSVTGMVHAPDHRKSQTFDLHHPRSLQAIAEFIENEPRDS